MKRIGLTAILLAILAVGIGAFQVAPTPWILGYIGSQQWLQLGPTMKATKTGNYYSLDAVGTGAAGPAGPAGPKGDTGAAGPMGPPGLPGGKGPAGEIGPAGAAGATGATGPEGAQGVPGPAGAQGLTGPAGAQGAPGSAGAQGAPGPAGLAGPAGAPGAKGLTGPTGAQGIPGLSGVTGATGPAGPTGPQGVPGAAGATGATGPAGPMGPAGPSGTGSSSGGWTLGNTLAVQGGVLDVVPARLRDFNGAGAYPVFSGPGLLTVANDQIVQADPKAIRAYVTGSATLTLGTIAGNGGCASGTIPIARNTSPGFAFGANAGDKVNLGPPADLLNYPLALTYAAGLDKVMVRLCDYTPAAVVTPAKWVWSADVVKGF